MPMNFETLIQQYGLITVAAVWVLHQIIKTWSFRANTDTTTDATMTSFAVDFKEENRQLQQEVRALQSEQSREAGKFEQLEATLIRERKDSREWERKTQEELFEVKASLNELKTARNADQKRITELEQQQINAMGEIDKLRSENNVLQAQKQELEKLLEREINRANSLSALIEKINKFDVTANTQGLPQKPFVEEADETFVGVTSAASVAAEEKSHDAIET